MKKIDLNLSKFQWNNLQKLHDYLVKNKELVKPHFDISVYADLEYGYDLAPYQGEKINTCGAVGCLIGHGPIAGIPAYKKDYDWNDYSDRVFGTKINIINSLLFDWVFEGDWKEYQPTLEEGIKRLAFVLKHKAVPANYKASDYA